MNTGRDVLYNFIFFTKAVYVHTLQETIAFSIATSVRTNWITSVVIQQTFVRPEADIAAVAPSFCVIISLLPVMGLVLCTRMYRRYRTVKLSPGDDGVLSEESDDGELMICLTNQEVIQDKETTI